MKKLLLLLFVGIFLISFASAISTTVELLTPANGTSFVGSVAFSAITTADTVTLKNSTLNIWYTNGSLFNRFLETISGVSTGQYSPYIKEFGFVFDSSTTSSNCDGGKFIPLKEINIINITKNSTITATGCRLLDNSGTLLDSGVFVGNDCNFEKGLNLTVGTTYRICTNGTSYNELYSDAYIGAINYTNLEWTGQSCYGDAVCGNTASNQIRNIINISSQEKSFNQNTSYWNVTTLNNGAYVWNAYSCGDNSGSYCSFASANRSFNFGLLINNYTYNASTYETAGETFSSNVSVSGTLDSAYLNYDGTSYLATTSASGSNYISYKTLDIPASTGNKSWFWIYNIGSTQLNSSITNQSVSALNISICGASPYNTPFINFTFKNETIAQQSVSASLSSSWTFWLSSASTNKTYSYSNTPQNFSYAFCGVPTDRTIYAKPLITYSNSESPQRSYNPNTLSLTSTVTNQVLYLLPTNNGIYVTFQVVNTAEESLTGVLINITNSNGLSLPSTTDASGTATFFLDPLTSHVITASKTGYFTFSETIIPTQNSYTINLGTGSLTGITTEDYGQGVTLKITPTLNYLNNNTIYNFTFNVTSTYWNIDQFGFVLKDRNQNVLKIVSSTDNGGMVNTTLDTAGNSTIFMNYYYIVNGNYTNGTTSWIIFDNSQTSNSIENFRTRLRLYIDNGGFFGLTDFSLNIICFLIIIIVGGVTSIKFGFDKPAMIIGIMLITTFVLDALLGFITYPAGFPDFLNPGGATWLLALVLIVTMIKESIT